MNFQGNNRIYQTNYPTLANELINIFRNASTCTITFIYCDMISEQKIDVRNVDLKKMRVKQLRKILQSWDEECTGCIEKTDFIHRIEELKDKHTEL